MIDYQFSKATGFVANLFDELQEHYIIDLTK